MIISKSKTKETVKKCNVSGDFYEALDKKVKDLIKDAEKRAVDNGRKTVRPCDLYTIFPSSPLRRSSSRIAGMSDSAEALD